MKLIDTLRSQAMIGMRNGDNNFEGVMLDNGAAKSPSGLSAYVRYCIHTSTEPILRESHRMFRSVGHGMISSLVKVAIRMPIGHSLCLTFDVDLIDQD
eukprot:IDg8929t1